MARILLLTAILFTVEFAYAQTQKIASLNQLDSLLNNTTDIQSFKNQINAINATYAKGNLTTYAIDTLLQWDFICSYKYGWEEVIMGSHDTVGVKVFTTEFDNIYCSRSAAKSPLTAGDIMQLFNIDLAKLPRDSLGLLIYTPIVMTTDKQYLFVGKGSRYPNGNQTSWEYSHNYYFRLHRE